MTHEDITRAVKMLHIAAHYIRFFAPDHTVRYDGAECGGRCVADDCDKAADVMSGTCEPRVAKCRHSHSWLIARGVYDWCAQCGALRPLIRTGVSSCTLHPEKSWAHPSVTAPPKAFRKRRRP